jgi:hypothetical protein
MAAEPPLYIDVLRRITTGVELATASGVAP